MVQKVNLSTANRAKSSVLGGGTSFSAPQTTSTNSNQTISSKLLLVVEQTALQPLLNPKKYNVRAKQIQSLKDYTDLNEKSMAAIFGAGVRNAPSDARADISFDQGSLDKLLDAELYNYLTNPTTPANDIKTLALSSALQEIRETIGNIQGLEELNKKYEELGNLLETRSSGRASSALAKKSKITLEQLGSYTVTGGEAKASERGYSGSYDFNITTGKLNPREGRKLSTRALSRYREDIENSVTPGTFVIPLGPAASKLGKGNLNGEQIVKYLLQNKEEFMKASTNDGNPGREEFKQLKDSLAMQLVRAKSSVVFFQYIGGNGEIRKSYNAIIKGSWSQQNMKPPKFDLATKTVSFAYSDTYEKQVQMEVAEIVTTNGDKLITDVEAATALGTLSLLDAFVGSAYKFTKGKGTVTLADIKLNTSQSIPTNRLVFKNSYVVRKTSGSAFQSRIGSVRSLLQETRVKTPSMGDFVTDDTITALTKREMLRRMPIGPIGGPPKSSRVLTYRTGRFVNSVQVIADMRSKAMQYYYDPNYWIHEATSRNPRNLIDSSINSVTRSLFGRRFNLVKANQSL